MAEKARKSNFLLLTSYFLLLTSYFRVPRRGSRRVAVLDGIPEHLTPDKYFRFKKPNFLIFVNDIGLYQFCMRLRLIALTLAINI